ncbi:hypothetical protein PHMEG_0008726 [Phytophthora megakarya]|uniref:Eukaryotic/viral aspartic protease n=1 Tax=Phytophthora megakarya TaxID=4795 RepID=A0A225WIT7_9STRA|nr:hypothetical protein PHMEG_0008726 [Phytophthora megakarya]
MEAGAELQKWKKKLEAAFGSQGVGVGRQPVSLAIGEKVNSANAPLPQTPKKVTKNVFASGEQSPYFQDSHMITPRPANRQQRLFRQSASTRYYRAKRMEKENIRDYLNRHNGYARNANVKFENGGRNARKHVKHFLETCGDKDLERQPTPMQLRDIYTLADVVSAILKVEKRVSGRESSKFSSRKDEERYGDSRNSYGRSDNRNRSHDRSRSEPCSTRVALADATLSDLISELQVRTPQEDVNDYSEAIPACIDETIGYKQNESDVEYFSQKKVQIDDPYAAQDEGVVAAANDNERRAELSLEVISVHNKVEPLQVNLIKVAIDLLLVKVCDSVTTVVDEASQNLSMDHALSVEVSIIRPTIASVDANCASRRMMQTNVKPSMS